MFLIRILLSFPIKYNFFIMLCSFFYFNSQCFVTLLNFLSFTYLAFFCMNMTFSMTLWTLSLHLHLKHSCHLNILEHHSLPIALRTRFKFTVFCSCSRTCFTYLISLKIKSSFSSSIKFFKSDRYIEISIRTKV